MEASAAKPVKTLYSTLITDLLKEANLREGAQGASRSTYCFRHTYATLRLQEGVDMYFLAEQMGTSVQMIERHYGHVNTIKHADRVLQGMAGWELPQPEPGDSKAKASVYQRQGKPSRSQRTDQHPIACSEEPVLTPQSDMRGEKMRQYMLKNKQTIPGFIFVAVASWAIALAAITAVGIILWIVSSSMHFDPLAAMPKPLSLLFGLSRAYAALGSICLWVTMWVY